MLGAALTLDTSFPESYDRLLRFEGDDDKAGLARRPAPPPVPTDPDAGEGELWSSTTNAPGIVMPLAGTTFRPVAVGPLKGTDSVVDIVDDISLGRDLEDPLASSGIEFVGIRGEEKSAGTFVFPFASNPRELDDERTTLDGLLPGPSSNRFAGEAEEGDVGGEGDEGNGSRSGTNGDLLREGFSFSFSNCRPPSCLG